MIKEQTNESLRPRNPSGISRWDSKTKKSAHKHKFPYLKIMESRQICAWSFQLLIGRCIDDVTVQLNDLKITVVSLELERSRPLSAVFSINPMKFLFEKIEIIVFRVTT